ncbi:protein kinase family protein [Actinomadura montaniterrae]|uniref:protein kinase family protein n=1 Tax=Actinomadura montaniterrae TaxID=1803903 RepID=UPI00178C7FAC|nr:protein kinase family protein [Actinomadura montaniterrae]
MSTSVIEPGTRLAGRYRLEERISDSGGSSLWKAIDEILARAVAVRTFDPEFPRVGEAVTSARAASRLTDPRVTQVFDADDSGESAYVVSEWVAGETLEQMLAKAPLEPGRAATLLYEAAEAISAAHAAGLAHLCLSPRDLVWTTGGTVKLLGVATDAVLRDRYSDEPAAEDVRGLGRMLYAALTAHWPGDEDGSGLPAAPAGDDGVPQAPRQVQAGISHAIDAIVCRCLGIGAAEPITEPAELAKALRGVPRTPLPLFAGLGTAAPSPRPAAPKRPATPSTAATTQPHQPPVQDPTRPAQPQDARGPGRRGRGAHAQHGQHAQQHAQPAPSGQVPPPRGRYDTPPPAPPGNATTVAAHARKPANRALLGIAAAALTVIVGLGAWALSGGGSDGDKGAAGKKTDQGQKSQPPKPATVKLKIQDASATQSPADQHPDGTSRKNPSAVIDGDPGTVWETQTYTSEQFGNYLKALGVTLTLGTPAKVSTIKVSCPVSGGTLQVRIGSSRAPGAMKAIGEQSCSRGELTFAANPAVQGQYVLVWFTRLPAGLKGKLNEISVNGTAG